MGIFTTRCLLEEAHNVVGNSAEVTLAVSRENTQETLSSLLGEVRLLEDALGRVDVGKVESGAGMARVEDGGQSYAWL